MRIWKGACGIGLFLAVVFAWSPSVVHRPPTCDRRPDAEGTSLISHIPAAFVPNLGQWEGPARYVARIGAMTLFLEDRGWTFEIVERRVRPGPRRRRDREGQDSARGAAVRMTFAGARAAGLVAEERLPGRHHYFLGNDPRRWRSDVPRYRSLRYLGVYPGIDVGMREQDGHFEYDLLLEPEADLEQVEVVVDGIDGLRLEGTALVLETAIGPVRMPAPVCYEQGPHGEKRSIECRYALRGASRFGFASPRRRSGWALAVDPGLVWSTYLGGKDRDVGAALAVGADGSAIVAGYTESADFPTTLGAFDRSFSGGASDAFVTRLSASGSSLVYSTFLGGKGNALAYAVALHAQGVVTVAGVAGMGFPTTRGAFDTTYAGAGDVFVARLSASGSRLLYSTYLGAAASDTAFAVAVDPKGFATVAGLTCSKGFPTTLGSFDMTYNGTGDAFVARLVPSGSGLAYSTFLGGKMFDLPSAIALDRQGAATVTGSTDSRDFPTRLAFDATHNGFTDAFVTRLSPSGAGLLYSTFLGGRGDDDPLAIAVAADGAATVGGTTNSSGFPTTAGAYDTTFNGPRGETDAFVTRLSPSGSRLIYSTFLGGAVHAKILQGGDVVASVALDANGGTTVAGFTTAPDFPTTPGAFDRVYNGRGGPNACVARLDPSGSRLIYSSFLGGLGVIHAGALDATGAATVVGVANASIPTTAGAFDTTPNGLCDAFVTRLDMLPAGVSMFGSSSPGCTGPLPTSVTSMPSLGNQSFALTCGHAPPNATGVVAMAANRLRNPLRVLGIDLWVDLRTLWHLAATTSNAMGAAELLLPVPRAPGLAGAKLYAQFVWLGPAWPRPCPPLGWSASNALEITIQK